jgi:ArsR family transcriptional regulator
MRDDIGGNNVFTEPEYAVTRDHDSRGHVAPDVTRTLRPLNLAAHPIRLKIILAIGAEEVSVQNIATKVGVTANNVSHHLALLGNNGVVASRRESNHIYYRVTDAVVPRLIALVFDMVSPP